jgi:hypothetical protein
MAIMQSKYSGRCSCGASFRKSATINYDRNLRKVVACPKCKAYDQTPVDTDNREPDLGRKFDMAYEDQCRDQCGL